ncbi:UNVERIFIED_CONTAM: hypothetical protein GTU68_019772 [Idotea baltica]|nr:hypothetical protein [Idotea baltica]
MCLCLCGGFHLKKLISQRIIPFQLRRNQPKSISWKYIWRTYWLCFEGTRLVDDNKKLLSFGISHKAKLSFLKKINKKE